MAKGNIKPKPWSSQAENRKKSFQSNFAKINLYDTHKKSTQSQEREKNQSFRKQT
jgi:hypothetical protein